MVQSRRVKHLDPKHAEFALYSPDEIKALSVVQVSVPVSFNALGYPMKNGLYDPLMGPMTERGCDLCATCQGRFAVCPGHMGHIELPVPVFNPLFIKTVAQLLRCACLSCYRLQVPGMARALVAAQMRLLDAGCVAEAYELADHVPAAAAPDPSNAAATKTSAPTTNSEADALAAKASLDAYVEKVLSALGPREGEELSKHVEAARTEFVSAALQSLRKARTCVCRQPTSRVSLVSGKLMVTHQRIDTHTGRLRNVEPTFMTPEEARRHLRCMWLEGASDFMVVLAPALRQVKEPRLPPDIFFLEVVPVPPPRARPLVFAGSKRNEHPQSIALQELVQNCVVVRAAVQAASAKGEGSLSEAARLHLQQLGGKSATEKLHTAWQALQTCVDRLVDAEAGGRRILGHQEGLKQMIAKKEGLVRMHMMGKRVNFAARSVITPDPNLAVDEIGVPEEFARTLTYPTPVTPWNVEALRRAVLAGPNVHPGAVAVRMENGKVQRIASGKDAVSVAQREGLAKRLLTPEELEGRASVSPKVVLRHLCNGDMLLLNRQPTLHRPSIMAHKVRVLRGERTLRLHYANCKAYNADFDGDEMNAHFPQNEVARAEAAFLADVPDQYLVPKDGSPLGGLIQDHVIAGVRLAARDTFLTRGEYCELLVAALPALADKPRLLPPAMRRPRRLWTGKQLLSSVLLNVLPPGAAPPTLLSKAKISSQAWRDGKVANGHMSEAKVVIREGELLCGVLDKQHLGSTTFGLTHVLHELYGGMTASRLLSAFGRLFTAVLQRNGFTLGVRDILVLEKADAKRQQLLRTAQRIGPGALASAAGNDETKQRELMERVAAGDLRARALLDAAYKSVLDRSTDAVSRACIPDGLIAPFPQNNLQLMVQSGAKGSTVNTLQISCLLGQIELEGRRPPLMPSGKALPSFRAGETEPRAGGFVAGRFLTGIRPQEFFFHCMAGREGLIDTAVKTSRSGYLQRCLIKHLEGLVVGYDGTVRDSDGSVIQFRYGGDGLDVTRSQFFNAQQLPILAENCAAYANTREMAALQEEARAMAKELGLLKMQDKARRWHEKRSGGKERRKEGKRQRPPDPAASHAPPGAIPATPPESLAALIDACIASQPDAQQSRLRDALWLRVARASAHAGDPVGVLAAQSIGEPSTQMTLNTFHFAGRGEMNVTLGIPRLRELLMLASVKIKTPSAEVPVRGHGTRARMAAEALRRRLRRTSLSDLLVGARVRERLEALERRRVYAIRLSLLPAALTKREHAAGPRAALKHVEHSFVPHLITRIKRRLRARQQLLLSGAGAAGAAGAADGEDEAEGEESRGGKRGRRLGEVGAGEDGDSSDDEPPADDEDATAARSRAQRVEEIEYDEPEEEEQESNMLQEEELMEDEDAEMEAAVKKAVKAKELLGAEEWGEGEEEEEEEEEEKMEGEEGIEEGEWEESDGDIGDDDLREEKTKRREFDLKSKCALVIAYTCGGTAAEGRWCEVVLALPLTMPRIDLSALVRDAAHASVVRETPGVRRAFLCPPARGQGELLLKTDGVNLGALQRHADVLDVNRLYTNDVAAVARTYGIEAARAVLVREVRNVFRAYGITVDARHLSLVADYMTFSGAYVPLSRKGLESATSPFQQMAFESTLAFVQSAALRGKIEPLRSPSARLMVGRPCAVGTGCFALRQKLVLC